MKVKVCKGGSVPSLHMGSSNSHVPMTTSLSSFLHKARRSLKSFIFLSEDKLVVSLLNFKEAQGY